jgi:hypothetical protein
VQGNPLLSDGDALGKVAFSIVSAWAREGRLVSAATRTVQQTMRNVAFTESMGSPSGKVQNTSNRFRY